MKSLTEKQEAFCQAYLETGNGAKAYRTSYGVGAANPKTMSQYVHRSLNNKSIAARIDELKKTVLNRSQLTFEGHLRKLADFRDLAIAKGNLMAAIRAEECRGKAAGFYKERFEVAGPDSTPLPTEITIRFVSVTRNADQFPCGNAE
jgi:hypothetical protein